MTLANFCFVQIGQFANKAEISLIALQHAHTVHPKRGSIDWNLKHLERENINYIDPFDTSCYPLAMTKEARGVEPEPWRT